LAEKKKQENLKKLQEAQRLQDAQKSQKQMSAIEAQPRASIK